MGMYDWTSFANVGASLAAVAGETGNAVQFSVINDPDSECGLVWLGKSNLFEVETIFQAQFVGAASAKVIAFRSQNLGDFDDSYVLLCLGGTPLNTQWILYKVVAGVWTQLDSFPEGVAVAVGLWEKHRIRCYEEAGKFKVSIERWIGPNPEDYLAIAVLEDSGVELDFGRVVFGSRSLGGGLAGEVAFDNIEIKDYIGPETGYFFDEFAYDEQASVGIPQQIEVVIRPDRKTFQIPRQEKLVAVQKSTKQIDIPI